LIEFEHYIGQLHRPALIAISAIVSIEPTTNPEETEIRLVDGRTMIALASYSRLRDAVNMIRNQFATLVAA
jgi:hypothetical protein